MKFERDYLSLVLLAGIFIDYEPKTLMVGLSKYLQKCERKFDSIGDEDGILICDDFGDAYLTILYSKSIIKFKPLGELQPETAFVVINTIAYLNSLDAEFIPAGLQSIQSIKSSEIVQPDNWAL